MIGLAVMPCSSTEISTTSETTAHRDSRYANAAWLSANAR